MATHDEAGRTGAYHGCCGCGGCCAEAGGDVSRRDVLKAGVALGGLAVTGLTWSSLAAAEAAAPAGPKRKPLIVKPILTYEIPRPRPQWSWRNWGSIHSRQAVEKECARIRGELGKLAESADFPVRFLDLAPVRNPDEAKKALAAETCDAVVVYAAGGWTNILDTIAAAGKHVIFFVRHRSGPVYLWYEIIHPRYLRRHGDALAVKGIDFQDVVVDAADELTWRLRALTGLKNALGTRILAIGGASGWGPGGRQAPENARKNWKLDIRDVPYAQLKKLIDAAFKDDAAVASAKKRTAAYLDDKTVTLETKKEFVENAFLLEQVFRRLLAEADATALTVNACMGTIIPMSKTTACLPLSTLNDDGYMAFCESDFVAIPAGILLSCISGKPPFLHNPTYPHGGVITLAHCTAPRRMDGKNLEPARIVTHFESDYGAAPKVEMRKGQQLTLVITDFASKRWAGLSGKIADAPFLPICRSQIDLAYEIPDETLAENMRGFHWQTVYGDYLREVGYALKKLPIDWLRLG